MGFRFVGANITNNSWIDYLFSVVRHRRFGDEVNGVGAVNAVPKPWVNHPNWFARKLDQVDLLGTAMRWKNS